MRLTYKLHILWVWAEIQPKYFTEVIPQAVRGHHESLARPHFLRIDCNTLWLWATKWFNTKECYKIFTIIKWVIQLMVKVDHLTGATLTRCSALLNDRNDWNLYTAVKNCGSSSFCSIDHEGLLPVVPGQSCTEPTDKPSAGCPISFHMQRKNGHRPC